LELGTLCLGQFYCSRRSFANCSAFGSSHLCVSFSHERKSERIEKKFETQNPNPELVMIGGNLSPQYLPEKRN
jgi:hypothetical protein